MAEIDIAFTDDIAEIVLNRPEKKNALRSQDWLLLREIVGELEKSAARCAIVRGAGGAFCAGWDLAQTAGGEVDAFRVVSEVVNPALLAIRNVAIPTLASVEGACVGGGLGIALACDIVLAAENAVMGSPFRNIGILPDSGAHYFLRERLGHHKACELIYTGRMIDGSEASRLGLVNAALPQGRLEGRTRDLAELISTGPTAALMASKRLLLEGGSYEETLHKEAIAQAEIFRTTDATEGLAAFLEKRTPDFTGR